MASHVTCTVQDGIARVRLDRPDKLNALTLQTLDDLVSTAHLLRKDRTLRAVVISGEGEAAPTPSRRPAGRGAGSRSR